MTGGKENRSPHDELNKIKATSNRYVCKDCDKEFEYMSQAENHRRAKGGGQPLSHDWTVKTRD